MKKYSLMPLVLMLSLSVFSQEKQLNWKEKVPLDPKVVYGKLPNGLTYYILHNEVPKDRAEFYIVNNVGAILENDNQNGLAHFAEHMSLNGTKNFPKKALIDFMEKNGVAFGHNVNAFTGQDVTAYMLSGVPTTREGLIDTSILVLHDWAGSISFENDEIDAERGVIIEEWRTRGNAEFRLRNKTAGAIYNGSKYVKRDVIGDTNVIKTFKHQVIKDFYNDWYRPDLQAVIIVGDVDAKKVEAKLKKRFSSIKKRKNPKERYYPEVPDNKEPLVCVATDPEAGFLSVNVMYKHDIVKPENKNMEYYKKDFASDLFSIMFNNRLKELTQKENPPFINARNSYRDFVSSKAAFMTRAMAKPGTADKALAAVLTENNRVKQYGFINSEFERAKAEFLKRVDKQHKEKDKTNSRNHVFKYFFHYLSGEPAPGAEYNLKFTKSVLPLITLEEVNALATERITENNMVVTVTGPEKEGIKVPTEQEVKDIIKKISQSEVEAYKETVSKDPFVTVKPSPSKLVSEKTEDGITEWKFANGVTVVLKPTDFKKDEILMTAYSMGGISLIADKDIPSAMLAGAIVSQSGAGKFTKTDIDKKLAGKSVRISPYINQNEEGFQGSCSPDDFETMLELMYLYHTQPRKDKTSYSAFMQRIGGFFENQSLNPNARFNDTVTVTMANNHPRQKPFNKELLSKVDFEKLYQIYDERFSDVNGSVYVFIGNINPQKVKPLIASYIGGLPSKGRKETFKNNNIKPPKGVVEKVIKAKLTVDKSTVYVNYNGNYEYTPFNNVQLNAFRYILRLRYVATIREEEGGSYGVRVQVEKNHYPTENYSIVMKFDCDPVKQKELTSIIYREIEKIKKNGPTKEDLQKTQEYFKKFREEQLKENSFWQTALKNKYYHGHNSTNKEIFEALVDKLTVKGLKKAANKYFGDNHVEIVMLPEK